MRRYLPGIPNADFVKQHNKYGISGESLLRYRNNFDSAFKHKMPLMIKQHALLTEIFLIQNKGDLDRAVRSGNKLMLVPKKLQEAA